MNDQRFYSLKELYDAAREACEMASVDHDVIRDNAFKPYGLRCYEARMWGNDEGRRGYTVFLSDASPDAVGLQAYVRDCLRQSGFEDVEVVTEW